MWSHRGSILQQWENKQLTWMWSDMGLNSTAVRDHTTDECGLTRDLILQQWETKQLTWMWSHMGLNSTAVRAQTNDLNVVSHGAQFYSSERPNNWLECGLTQAQFYSSERPNNWLECGLIQGSILQQWDTEQLTWMWSHKASILQQWDQINREQHWQISHGQRQGILSQF